MSTTTRRRGAAKEVRLPEKKIGPFHAGLGVAIWLNNVETDQGPRFYRSITIAKRRYKEAESGEWKDASSYRPMDLTTLVLALEKALDFCRSTPLPGEPLDGEDIDFRAEDNGESPPPGT